MRMLFCGDSIYRMSNNLISGIDARVIQGLVNSVPPALRGPISSFLNGKITRVEDPEGFFDNLTSLAKDMEAGGVGSFGEIIATFSGAIEAGMLIAIPAKIAEIVSGLGQLFGIEHESVSDKIKEKLKQLMISNPELFVEEQAGRAKLMEDAQKIADEIEAKQEEKERGQGKRTRKPRKFRSDDPLLAGRPIVTDEGLVQRKEKKEEKKEEDEKDGGLEDVELDPVEGEEDDPQGKNKKKGGLGLKDLVGIGGAVGGAIGLGLGGIMRGGRRPGAGEGEGDGDPGPPGGDPGGLDPGPPGGDPGGLDPGQDPRGPGGPGDPDRGIDKFSPLGKRLKQMLAAMPVDLAQVREFTLPDDSVSYNYVDYARAVDANNVFQNNLFNTSLRGNNLTGR